MNLRIHTAVISHDEGTTHYVSASHGDLIARIGDWCREHWSSISDEPPPQSTRDLIDAYFYDNTDDFLEVTEDTIELPQPYASGPELFAALQGVAGTPKHGEPEPCDAEFNQDWEADMGKFAIARLHELIDSARAALTNASLPSVPSNPRFTVFCQEAGCRGDTVHIASHTAADLESAIIAGKQQCIIDWSSGFEEGETPWNLESVHCLGVAAGDVEILHWEDQAE
jgi:hypothetical protein